MPMPLVTVIIPTYNRLKFLAEAVDSVLNQTFKDFELLIIDDGSTDGTHERFSNAAPPIRYIHQPHTGVSAARNRGIKEAEGSFIAFLDSDDCWLPEKLAVQVDFLQKHPEVLICQTEEKWIRCGKHANPKNIHKKPSGNVFDKSLLLCVISPSAVMMRKKFFEIVGLFDEKLPVCEDYDLWLRAAYRMEVPLIPKPLTVKHGGHDDQLSGTFWGMDRFRVYALQKLLDEPISEEQRSQVTAEIGKKCSILIKGALKRHRYLFAIRAVLTKKIPTRQWGLI